MNPALEAILDCGVVAIIRSRSAADLLETARALARGGVRAVEVTLTTPGALEAIREAADRCAGEFFIGAGSVLDAESARMAIDAGAEFLVMPVADAGAIRVAKRYGKAVCPGAMTPTEILTCLQAGADVVKVFPAASLGPGYIKAVRAPLPQAPLMPVGGVSEDNAADYVRAGACALGVGGSLVSTDVIARGDFDAITAAARRLVEAIGAARQRGPATTT